MTDEIQKERDRCMRIVSAARNGDIDQDLRTLLHFIRSGDQMLRDDAAHRYVPDYKRKEEEESARLLAETEDRESYNMRVHGLREEDLP